MIRIALYPGSFDPITNGHIDIIYQTLKLVDQVIVAVGLHDNKNSYFSFQDRINFIYGAINNNSIFTNKKRINVKFFSNLAVDTAIKYKAKYLIRGLRDGTDLNYEIKMASMNKILKSNIYTIFLPASINVRHISSTLVRQIIKMNGNINSFVPEIVSNFVSKNK